MLTTSPTGHASWSVFRSSGLQKAVLGAVALAALGLGSCSPSGGTGDAKQGGDADLVELLVGRLVDVYGLRAVPNGGMDITLFEADVVIGPDIQDERDSNSTKRDSEIEYDFIGVDPETLQQKLLIPREVGSKDFQELFDKVDDIALSVAAASYGQDTKSQPYTIVPRNCGFELRFSKDLGVTEDFFLAKDANGKVTGIKNPEAVQLLEIRGDPRDNQHVGDFRLIGARIAYKGNKIILDPVILGAEGRNLNLPNTAKGLPQSPNSIGSNIRLALTLEGPLRLRGLRAVGSKFGLVGTNLAARQSIIRDFRSGNASDNNLHTSNGFVNDATPPRVVGEMSMRLERVDIRGPFDQRVLLYKAGIEHEVDRGDVLKLYPVNSEGQPVGTSEVVADPIDDFNRPEEQHVVVRVRDASKFLELDPSTHPDYPGNIKEREAWLIKNAPTIVLSTEFNGEKDDPLNFLSFSPRPIPDPDKDTVAQNRNVSPGASLIVRFTKPVDLGTVRSFDSLILATLEDTVDLLSPKEGTPHLIQSQVFDEDGSQTALRSAPPLGFYVDDEMRKPANKDRYPYFMHLVGGINGIRDLGGRSLDFQFFNKAREFVSFSFHLDVNRDKSGRPRFPNSRVVTLARRFLDKDEDEDAAGELDAFGAIVYQDGQVSGRPTSRLTAFVDDRNQLPSPPTPPLAYCPGGTTATLTGGTPFGSPIQNPLNPLGGRLQTIWREVDLSLSRTDPYDFNLDCEGMWWAPFQATNNAPKTQFDIFDRISLYVGHSERRPSPCVGVPSSLPQFGSSGLRAQFFANFVKNHKRTATNPMNKASVDTQPDPHLAYVDQQLVIRNEDSVFEPNGVNRFLPLPAFQDPLFTWRDERVMETGGGNGNGGIISPFKGNGTTTSTNFWDSASMTMPEDGRVAALALPLLVDHWVYPDNPNLPENNPFRATGFNGWQISLTVQSSSLPYWRAYSGGGRVGQTDKLVDPSTEDVAKGGYTPTGNRTAFGDNSCYWGGFDFIKSVSVMTFGFIDLVDPHDDKANKYDDPRLGPYVIAPDEQPAFETYFDPPLSTLPSGTKLVAEYRGADVFTGKGKAFDPGYAGDAHIRFYDAGFRDWGNHLNTVYLTDYLSDPNELYDSEILKKYTIKGKVMTPQMVRLINWRFIMLNNTKVDPPAAAKIDSFSLTYKIDKR